MEFTEQDYLYMQRALELAQEAADRSEVPVGAVIVGERGIIAEAFNMRETTKRPTAHAEILAIDAAAAQLNTWRLNQCILYVTLEPCAMCAGAIVNSRIGKVIFGAHDPKAGCAGSLMNICQDARLNHRSELEHGLLADESSALLKHFFRARRRA